MVPLSDVHAKHYKSEDALDKLVQGTIHRDKALELADKYAKTREPVLVAVLDTGANMKSKCFPSDIFDREHSVHVGKGYKKYSKINGDRTGHGNIVTRKLITTVGGRDKAEQYIRIMEIDIFDEGEADTNNYNCGAGTMAKGIRYAADNGAQVINISHSIKADHDSKFARKLNKAIDYAVSKGCIVVTSGGNNPTMAIRYPSCAENGITVMTCQDNWTNAWSKSETVEYYSNFGQNRKICAPGAGYTSLAAPTVAGVAALMKYVNPELTAGEARTILYETATDIYKDGIDPKTGYGCVNAQRAVGRAAGIEVPVPELDPVTFSVSKIGIANTLRWNEVQQASRYKIYRATSRNGRYKLIDTIPASECSFVYEDNTIKNNRNYFYKMSACGTVYHYKAYSKESETIPVIRNVFGTPDFNDL